MWMRRVERGAWTTGGAAVARRISGLNLRQRFGLRMGLDGAALVFGLVVAQVGRYGFRLGGSGGARFWAIAALSAAMLWFIGTALHLYLGRYRFGAFEEVRALFIAV